MKQIVGFGVSRNGSPFRVRWQSKRSEREVITIVSGLACIDSNDNVLWRVLTDANGQQHVVQGGGKLPKQYRLADSYKVELLRLETSCNAGDPIAASGVTVALPWSFDADTPIEPDYQRDDYVGS